MTETTPHVTFQRSSGETPITAQEKGISGTSASTSELPGYIQSVPWESGFSIGFGTGVNAITGQIEAPGVLPFKVTPSEVKHSLESFRTIRYESNLMEELSVGGGVTLNIGQVGLGVGASSSLLSRARVSATSFTILATYTTTYKDFDLAPDYTLKPEAVKIAQSDPAEFRQRYGDYFVAGGQRSSTFTALLIYSSSDLDSLTEFATRINANLHDLFRAEGSASWTKQARDAGVELEVYVEMRGYRGTAPGGPWDASKAVDALEWFKKHEVGDFRFFHAISIRDYLAEAQSPPSSNARLQHYSTLDFNIPRSIPVPGAIFEDIRKLHLLLRSSRILSGSCPETEERSRLSSETSDLCQQVDSAQGSLAVDSQMCTDFLERAKALYKTLGDIHRRYKFWVHVQNQVSAQPVARMVAEKNQKFWSYGFSSYPYDSTIQISSTRQTLVLPRTLSPFRRDGTLSYVGSPDRLIVGWKVISNRTDGHNGSWRRLAQSMLLSNSARVTFRTDRFRAADWELVTYHVEARLYRFSRTGFLPSQENETDLASGNVSPLLKEIQSRDGLGRLGRP